jgi:pre-mRNA-splicing factor CWC22
LSSSAAIFDRLRSVLQESEGLDIRVQYMIEVLMHIRKSKFEVRNVVFFFIGCVQGHAAIVDGLDLIEEDDQITHTLSLEEAQDPENSLSEWYNLWLIRFVLICRRISCRSGV